MSGLAEILNLQLRYDGKAFILVYFKKLEQLTLNAPLSKGIFKINVEVAYTIIKLLQKAAVTLNIPAFYIWLSTWISSYFLHVSCYHETFLLAESLI